MIKVGVLDLQGSVIEHINILNNIEGVIPIRVKYAEQLKEIDGLILPGGESTTIGKLLRMFNLDATLKKRIEEGMPVWGTCAGMILLAKSIDGQEEVHLNVMDIKVKRNAYGSQLDSFVVDEKISEISEKNIPLVFIRAPYIQDVGEKVQVIKKVNGNIVAAKEKNMLVTSFHPELTEDDSVHRYFINSFFS
ncbi:pyridoxal 5'-phosphate synthase glutaminase subunit PdxT [Clostridium sp. MB40-C1]|uniref:pyridoxal 5'-phosphate synthase glutaminase subunit PdxT n=1 Tax=Clostridium sp. MB40-C1 TaxID=3070996 RepID=UPI0027E123D4|nr:pyridoxal 5'-phosphate synthase glutaminase subunit PdxT [Clostridium sp. MB40-C1]WMJ79879.1 pyridoxal 5'-phosphate synthase glutaminase subunit PdxT [Clostridium sp. MB40-C1]